MIASGIRIDQLSKYGLGGHDPPKDAVDALQELDKNLLLIWNIDQWEIYRNQDNLIHWQKSCPTKGLTITSGIKNWLQKFDTSRGGRWDIADRKKQFLSSLYSGLAEDAQLARAREAESMREVTSLSRFAQGKLFGGSGISVPEGPVIGHNNGVPVRMYRRKIGGNRSIIT